MTSANQRVLASGVIMRLPFSVPEILSIAVMLIGIGFGTYYSTVGNEKWRSTFTELKADLRDMDQLSQMTAAMEKAGLSIVESSKLRRNEAYGIWLFYLGVASFVVASRFRESRHSATTRDKVKSAKAASE
jgi:hypothetical protein